MDVHPPKNGINRYWSIPNCLFYCVLFFHHSQPSTPSGFFEHIDWGGVPLCPNLASHFRSMFRDVHKSQLFWCSPGVITGFWPIPNFPLKIASLVVSWDDPDRCVSQRSQVDEHGWRFAWKPRAENVWMAGNHLAGRENEQNAVTHEVPIKNCLRLPWVESKTMFRWSNSTCLLIFWLISIFVNLHFVAYMFPFLSLRSPFDRLNDVGIQENTCHCSPEFWLIHQPEKTHAELEHRNDCNSKPQLWRLFLKLGCKFKCNRLIGSKHVKPKSKAI